MNLANGTWADIKGKNEYKKFKDIPLSWIESIGSKMNVYAWNKRWANRKKGTGYRDEVE